MADIELVVKMPKRVYNYIRKYEHIANSDILDIKDAIINGTLLPKGHGDLIDSSYEVSTDGRTIYDVCGYLAPTIIEADAPRED